MNAVARAVPRRPFRSSLRNWSLLAVAWFAAFGGVSSAEGQLQSNVGNQGGVRAEAKSADILSLLRGGEVELQLTADGAYQLEAKVHNLTDDPLQVDFPPGLVADGYAQNQYLAQIIGQGNRGGSQGLGILDPHTISIAARATGIVNLRTCCLNYGVPEPNRRSPLFLKSVADYTSNVDVQRLLPILARNHVDTMAAQPLLWRHTNGLSWEMLSKMGIGPGKSFSDANIKTAQQIDHGSSSEPAVIADGTPGGADRPTRIRFSVHADPRGAVLADAATRNLARTLTENFPGFSATHANYLEAPADPDSPALQCGVLVQARPGGRNEQTPFMVTMQAYEWVPKQQTWRPDKPFSAIVPASAKGEEHIASESRLAEAVVAELAGKAIDVKWSRGGQKQKLTVVNKLPIPLTSVAVRDSKKGNVSAVIPLDLAAQSETTVELNDEQAKSLAAAQKLSASRFDVAD